jgi:hypothetical protein
MDFFIYYNLGWTYAHPATYISYPSKTQTTLQYNIAIERFMEWTSQNYINNENK